MGGAALLGGFLGGVTEGVTQHFVDKKAEKKQLSDEERQAKYDQLSTGIKGAQTKLATLAPGSPEYAQTMDDITAGHSQLTDLFHPDTGPGALAHLGRIVSEKWLHKPAPTQMEVSRPGEIPSMNVATGGGSFRSPDLPGAPGVTMPGMAGPAVNLPAQAAPQIAHPVPFATAAEAKQKSAEFMTRLGIEGTPAPAAAAPDMEKVVWLAGHDGNQQPFKLVNGAYQPVQGAAGFSPPEKRAVDKEMWEMVSGTVNGQPVTLQRNKYDGTFNDLNGGAVPPETLKAFVPSPKSATHPSTAEFAAWVRSNFGGRNLDELTPEESAQAEAVYHQQRAPTTTSTGQSLVFDNENQAHVFTHTGTNSKSYGGGKAVRPSANKSVSGDQAGGNNTDATPASLKQRAQAIAPKAGPSRQAKTPIGPALPFSKRTPEQTIAKKAVDVAQSSYLDVQKASPGDPTGRHLDPVGSQGIILAWLRGRVNRVTATEIEAVNNLGGVQMKMEGTAAKYISGTMTPQQYQWFLRSARDNYENAQTIASKYDSAGTAPTGQTSDFNWDAHPTVK